MSDFNDSTASTPVSVEPDVFHAAHLGAAVGDVPALVKAGGRGQFDGHRVAADTEHDWPES